MRFVLKSVFWLGLAFLTIHPNGANPVANLGADLNAAAQTVSTRAVAAGQDLMVQAIQTRGCTGGTCSAGNMAVAALHTLTSPSGVPPMQDSPEPGPVPFPRLRPIGAG